MGFRKNMMEMKKVDEEPPSKRYTPLSAEEIKEFTEKVAWIQNGGLKGKYNDVLQNIENIVSELKAESVSLVESTKIQLQKDVRQVIKDANINGCVKAEIGKSIAKADTSLWIWKLLAVMMSLSVWTFGLYELSRLWGGENISYCVVGFICILLLICLLLYLGKNK